MIKEIYESWKKIGLEYFWGDMFDVRFYIADLISKKSQHIVLDIGCGAGILLHFSKAKLKVGIDFSLDSLKKGKSFDSSLQLIQADVNYIPFKNNTFPHILAIHMITEFKKKKDWVNVSEEIKRISAERCEIIIAGANRLSKYFQKTHTFESRESYLGYNHLVEIFNS